MSMQNFIGQRICSQTRDPLSVRRDAPAQAGIRGQPAADQHAPSVELLFVVAPCERPKGRCSGGSRWRASEGGQYASLRLSRKRKSRVVSAGRTEGEANSSFSPDPTSTARYQAALPPSGRWRHKPLTAPIPIDRDTAARSRSRPLRCRRRSACAVIGPGILPSPTAPPLKLRTGRMQRLVEVRNISSALAASNRSMSPAVQAMPSFARESIVICRLTPGST